MKIRLAACFVVATFFSVAMAAPVDRVVLAAMQLSDQPNYSWVSTVADDARSYEISGKTERGGFTRVKMPIVNAIRRRLARSVTDSQIDAIFKGNVRCVISTDEGWKLIDELPPPEGPPSDAMTPLLPTVVRINKASRTPREEADPGPYSNLQTSICHPHEELGVIVTSHTDLDVQGDIATGKLNELGAQLLLVHDGQTSLTPLRATGSFKLWMRNGAVTRYQIALDGVLAVELRGGSINVNVHQTIDTTLTAVGATKVDVPDEAKRKLP